MVIQPDYKANLVPEFHKFLKFHTVIMDYWKYIKGQKGILTIYIT